MSDRSAIRQLAWACVNRSGHILADTVAYRRRDAIKAVNGWFTVPWRTIRRRYGMRCIRVLITEHKP